MSTNAAESSAAGLRSDALESFNPWSWAAGIAFICLTPLLLLSAGFDFSTQLAPLSEASVQGLTGRGLGEAAHAALRGSYTHTLLEWTATIAAFFLCALAFVQYRLSREPSLPPMGDRGSAIAFPSHGI